jgi:hypothetical protein
MSTMSLRLPESLHEKVREVARKEGISINHLVTLAVAEKLSALLTEEYILQRAARGSRKKFERVLRKVADVPPQPGDEAPDTGGEESG